MRSRMGSRDGRAEPGFYRGKRVLVTGHTGFKGGWLCKILALFGARVTGIALPPATIEGGEFFRTAIEPHIDSVFADIRDFDALLAVFLRTDPEIVFHLAAQPLVQIGYQKPVETFSTNIMGTVHVLECIRLSKSVRSFVNVTTDKVYDNREWCWGYRENELLDGHDPYANSKSCSELVTHSYQRSFFQNGAVAISTARAGNVIGGGDFSPNRILPDCIRAAWDEKPIEVRNPSSVRPYQHVLEPLYAYLMLAQAQYEEKDYMGAYNVGPRETDCITTRELAEMFCRLWGEGQEWKAVSADGPHEARMLRLDCSKLRDTFGWQPRWNVEQAVEATIEWAKAYRRQENISSLMERQIHEFWSVDGNGKAGTA